MAWTFSVMLSIVRSFKLTGAAMMEYAMSERIDVISYSPVLAERLINIKKIEYPPRFVKSRAEKRSWGEAGYRERH
jgi:hypothetical protein